MLKKAEVGEELKVRRFDWLVILADLAVADIHQLSKHHQILVGPLQLC